MWVIYRKSDLQIMGMSAHCETELDKEFALKEVVSGLVNPGRLVEYDAIQVTDQEQVNQIMTAMPGSLLIKQVKKGKLELVIEEPTFAYFVMRCDAPDVHPADGIPEIQADGSSFTKISIQKVNEKGEPLQGNEVNDLLYLRTNYGTLMSADGKKEIGSIELEKGKAVFRLVSEKAKRVATVEVFNADQSVNNTSIRIEFI